MRGRSGLLVFLGVASFGLTLTAVLPGRWAGAAFVALAVAFPVALAALGAARGRRGGAVLAVLAAVGLALEAAFFTLLALAGRVPETPWPGGLPLAVWVLLAGVWGVPLVVVPLLYAWSFEPEEG